MNACRRVCTPASLGIPARRATRRTTRAAPCRSGRCPSEAEENRPAHALADGQVDRPGRARCQRDSDDLAALARNDQRAVPALDAQVLGC